MSDSSVTPEATELDKLWAGLSAPQKRVSSKYFYDQRGSELFEQITRLEEYYPTRTERALLERWAGPIVTRLAPRTLIELGAGSARKTRILLDAMARDVPGARYVPVDVSGDFLNETADELRAEYPALEIVPAVADFTTRIGLDRDFPRPAVVALLGSTIGNFAGPQALGIIRSMAELLGPSDHLMLGADLRPGATKSAEELERAYNDAAGVTATFNLNLLKVLNRSFETDFDPARFDHLARWVEEDGRIEMHLVAREEHAVVVPGKGPVTFESGESLRTEVSCKYDRATLEGLFSRAGLRITDWLDSDGRYALVLGRPVAR